MYLFTSSEIFFITMYFLSISQKTEYICLAMLSVEDSVKKSSASLPMSGTCMMEMHD